MIHGDAEGVKAGRGLAVKPDGGLMKRMPGSALARLERLDAGALKASDDVGNPGIDIPVTALRRVSGHGGLQTHQSLPTRDRQGAKPIAATAEGRRRPSRSHPAMVPRHRSDPVRPRHGASGSSDEPSGWSAPTAHAGDEPWEEAGMEPDVYTWRSHRTPRVFSG